MVAADDGIMPQTVESINHAKAAESPHPDRWSSASTNKTGLPGSAAKVTLDRLSQIQAGEMKNLEHHRQGRRSGLR